MARTAGFGWLQHGVKAAEDGHGEDHVAVFATDEDVAQDIVRDVPDKVGDPG
jgi:hypothetical protein